MPPKHMNSDSHATLEKEMTGVPPMLNVDYMIGRRIHSRIFKHNH